MGACSISENRIVNVNPLVLFAGIAALVGASALFAWLREKKRRHSIQAWRGRGSDLETGQNSVVLSIRRHEGQNFIPFGMPLFAAKSKRNWLW